MEQRLDSVVFRYVQEKDLPLYYAMYSSPEVMQFTLIDACRSVEAYLPYFVGTLEDSKKPDRLIYEYVVGLLDGQPIGMGNIKLSETAEGNAEIGYMLLPQYWGKGFGTMVAKRLVQICFVELGLIKVSACCNANNLASEAVMKKCGMRLEALLKAARYKGGEWQDELHYAITYGEWSGITHGNSNR